MQDLIDKVISNPLYLTLGVILIVVLLYAVIKRIMKLLIFLIIAVILFLVYVHYTGNTVKDKIERMIK
jgi:cell division protein FtsW (lipid II flippase)